MIKKILLTVLAAAGMAIAGTAADFEKELAETLTKASYDSGTPYKITVGLNNLPQNSSVLELKDGFYLVNQWHRYWGFNQEKNNEITDNGAYTLETSDSNYTYTSSPAQLPILWAQNAEGTQSGVRNAGNHIYVTISSDGKDTTIVLDYDKCYITDTIILKGTVLDPRQFRLTEQASVINHSITVEESSISPITIGAVLAGALLLCVCMVRGQRS